MDTDTFDYVVVGGGTAGCVLTNRLSEDGSSVCLLEAGPADVNPSIHIPAGYIKNIYSKTLTWGFSSQPVSNLGGLSFSLPQGRVLGGSSSINGLNYVRGQRADYDEWAEQGNPGWTYREVLPYFKRSERRIGPGDDRFRGRTVSCRSATLIGITRCAMPSSMDLQPSEYRVRWTITAQRMPAAVSFKGPSKTGCVTARPRRS